MNDTGLTLALTALLAIPSAAQADSVIEGTDDVPTLIVDGQPFLIFGAQCDIWRSTHQDEQTVAFLDGYAAMHASTVSVGIPWAKVETEEGVRDFAFLDWFIDQAESRGLRLVVNLFNTNVCGKVMEKGWDGNVYPQYTPSYILDRPRTYQRMVLGGEAAYVPGGPPMCPNDPDTLARERAYVAAVARHLRERDTSRTVIMLQLNNEFYYQQWAGNRPAEPERVRCHCEYCDALYDEAAYANEEEFMFRSLARYAASLSEAIVEEYDIPLYVNSPWWDPSVVGVFLDECPQIDLVGIDGVFSPVEPNMLSRSQVGRNIPFAAECPTEHDETKMNLGVLPYYALFKSRGLGNLLWEAPPPHSVVGDDAATKRYAAAMLPLKAAMVPIARARGTEGCLAWFAVGFDLALDEAEPAAVHEMLVIHGRDERTVQADTFDVELAGIPFRVDGTSAGAIVHLGDAEFVIATSGARVTVMGVDAVEAKSGAYDGDEWHPRTVFPAEEAPNGHMLTIAEPAVIRLDVRK